MEYNTKREKLKINDYGRNIYKMIRFAMTIEDRKVRTQAAEAIVKMMAEVNPQNRDSVDYEHRLWDHLMIMSDWKLDVDCPYELSHNESVVFSPRRLAYKQKTIQYRHYGRCLEQMVEKVSQMDDSEEKDLLNVLLTTQMKKSYLTWNRDLVNNDIIDNQMQRISKGRMSSSPVEVRLESYMMPNDSFNEGKKSRKKKKRK